MSAAKRRHTKGEAAVPMHAARPRPDVRLADLHRLATIDIETSLVSNLSGELHALFDHVSEDTLPIYFGPLLGRLYLEGL